jgi:hypothetical protein
VKVTDEGIVLHQSDLKSHCLEQMRLKMITDDPPAETDAATVGTCLHDVIDHELAVAPFDSEADAVAYGAAYYVELLEHYQKVGSTYSMATFETHDRALKALSWLVKSWYHSPERHELMYGGDELHSETSFHLPFCTVPVKKHGKKAEDVPVFLAGTMDLVYANRVYDWKTAGSEYKQWEYQRWGRQPDVYTWAAAQLGLVQPDSDGLYYFDFKVFVRRQEIRLPDTVTVKRGPNHWAWLEVMVNRLVNMWYNLGTEVGWPLDDQHVLCSDRWCPFWSQCKGVLIDPTKGWT